MKILPITQDPPVEIFSVPTASIPVDINVAEPQPGTSQTPESVNMQQLAQELALPSFSLHNILFLALLMTLQTKKFLTLPNQLVTRILFMCQRG